MTNRSDQRRWPIRVYRRLLPIALRQLRRRCRSLPKGVLRPVEDALIPLTERPLFAVCIGMFAGIIIGSKLPLTLLHIISMMTLCGWLFVNRAPPHLQRCCRFFATGLIVSHLLVTWQLQALPLDHIARFSNNQPIPVITIEGQLYRPVERLETHQRLYLSLHRLKVDNRWQIVKGQVRLNLHSLDGHYLPADVLRIRRIRLYPIRGYINPGAFDFKTFMRQRNIYAVGGISRTSRVEILHRPGRFILPALLERWRLALRTQLHQSMTPSSYNTFMAMIFGQRGYLPPHQLADFRTSGIAHLLVVSGLHVGFIASAFFVFFRTLFRHLPGILHLSWRPTSLAIAFSLFGIVIYCSIVGWGVSTTRAAVMVSCSLLALSIGRIRELPYAIAFAAIFLCMVNPLMIFSIGFQLSFVTVSCIALALNAPLRKPSATTPIRTWLRRGRVYLVVSLAAYLGTLPILANAFHTVPLYGLIANLTLVPLAGLVVPYSLIYLCTLAVSPHLATYFGWPVGILLHLMSELASFFATLPYAQIYLPRPSWGMVLGYYGLLTAWFLTVSWRRRLLGITLCLAVFFVSLGFQYMRTTSSQLRVTFLDVGSGDAILIQLPGRKNLLIDGGGTYNGRFDIGARVIAPVLWDQYIDRIDFMAMTHPQSNHARGLVSIMRLFPTDHLMTNGTPLEAPYLRQLLELGEKWGTRHHTPSHGLREWQWGRLKLTLLSPPSIQEQSGSAWQPPTENDKSLVFRLEYGDVRILLTGDIHKSTEQWLMQHRDVRADILQVAHHGSGTSSSLPFVSHVNPQVAIISLGANNRYGHPHPRVLRNLNAHNIRIFRTDQHGAITITTDGVQFAVTPLRP